MHPILETLITEVDLTGDLSIDVPNFLNHHGFPKTAQHSRNVAEEAYRLAQRFDADSDKAKIGGWLHDISVVFPSAERADIAREFGIEVLPEEDIFPMIIHQKLSVVIAREIFKVDDEAILSAIGCHTTLKENATLLDKIVFVADKIAWDQVGTPPYLDDLLMVMGQGIDHAAFVYLDYLWNMRDKLKVLHPYTAIAHTELQEKITQS